jgi:hypothetical protein
VVYHAQSLLFCLIINVLMSLSQGPCVPGPNCWLPCLVFERDMPSFIVHGACSPLGMLGGQLGAQLILLIQLTGILETPTNFLGKDGWGHRTPLWICTKFQYKIYGHVGHGFCLIGFHRTGRKRVTAFGGSWTIRQVAAR